MSEVIVLKVGGSCLSPSKEKIFDFEFVDKLKVLLNKYISSGHKFVLCVGGGYVCRYYQNLLAEQNLSEENLHDVGVAAINLNAVVLQSCLTDISEHQILRYADYENNQPLELHKPILVTAAGKSGHSSDWNTAKLALRVNSKKVISLKNVDGVYTADPKKDVNAKKVDKLTWKEYLNLIGNPPEHAPGSHYPVDPLAARLSDREGIKFFIVDGKDLKNLEALLGAEEFVGTEIY